MKSFKKVIAIILAMTLIFCNLSFLAMAEDETTEQPVAKTPAEYVDTTYGNGSGSTIKGPTMPNGAIHPAVNTTNPNRGGCKPGQPVVGFAQMHVQGTGGTYSYGNFMLSPQTGEAIITDENSRASAISNEVAQAHYYSATLDKYNVQTEITTDEHTAIYRITYPAGSQASLLFDASRKLTNELSMTSGNVTIAKSDAEAGTPLTISGGGRFKGNWNPGQWNMYFNMEINVDPATVGTWDGQNGMVADNLSQDFISGKRLGAFMTFDVPEDEQLVVIVKISISMESVENAKKFMADEIPEWDFEAEKTNLLNIWNEKLSAVKLSENETDETKRRFYTALYHTNIHPRDKTDDTGEWDDFYTIWDMWKSEFPLLSITRTDVIKGHLNSLISRSKENAANGSSYNNVEWKGAIYGTVSDAYIQGVEYYAGQGGSDIDCVIGDAFLKFYNDESFSDVDWEALYGVLLANAGHRTSSYLSIGYQASDAGKNPYSWRLCPTSATLGFSYNDYCVAQAAKLLGYTDDYEKYITRSRNYLNLWDEAATSDGFNGFFRNKNSKGEFGTTDPKGGYNTDLYEADIWEGIFMPVYDVEKLVEIMGGKGAFIKRLSHALESGYIDFGNEPSFQTPWLASTEEVRRPDLTTVYVQKFLNRYSSTQYPGDEDNGAMSSSYVFMNVGFYPFSGTNNYYIHGPRVSEATFDLANGKTFKVTADNAGGNNIYVQSATWNGVEFNDPYFTYEMMMEGGELHFVMGSEPSMWARVPDTEAPSDVTNIKVDESAKADDIISLTWDEATDNEGIDKYVIYRGTTADFEISDENLLATTSDTSFKMFMATGTYYFKIYAKDMSGNLSKNPGLSGKVVLSMDDIVVITDNYSNLALNKKATASAFVKDAEGPSYAVDGSTNTKWCDNTSSEFWLEVDLGATYKISKWVVTHAGVKENAKLNTTDFSLQILTEAGWTDVDTVKGNKETVTSRLLEAPVNARYVRLYITGAQDPNAVAEGIASKVAARIYEFELYSLNEDLGYSYLNEDVDYTKSITYALKDKMTITSSEAVNASETADKVFDADKNSKFSGKTNEKWIAVDLGSKYIVDKFVLLSSGTENVTYITKDFTLQYMDDNGKWQDAVAVLNNTVDNAVIKPADPITAQQFRLWITNPVQDNFNGYTRSARIREWHLYGTQVVPNMADSVTYKLRNAMTITSSTAYKETESAKYVFDNSTATKFSSIVDGDKWIAVDLGESYTISEWMLVSAGDERETNITYDFSLRYLDKDGQWQIAQAVLGNKNNVAYMKLDTPISAQCFKLWIDTPVQPEFSSGSRTARIKEWHLFGTRDKEDKDDLLKTSITYQNFDKLKVEASGWANQAELPINVFDANANTKWTVRNGVGQWLTVDLGGLYTVNQMMLLNAGNEFDSYITRGFKLQVWQNEQWVDALTVTDNTADEVYFDVAPVVGQLFRIYFTEPVQPGEVNASARLREFHLFGEQYVPPTYELTADADAYTPSSIITLTATVPDNVAKIGIANENGRYISIISRTSAPSDRAGYTEWTIKLSVATVGSRTLTLCAANENMEMINTGASVSFIISKILPSGTDEIKVNSVRTKESVKANEVFTITARTSKSATNIGVFSESGKAFGKISQTYVDNDDERVWTIAIKIGSKGNRSFNVKACDLANKWSDGVSFDIVVY